MNDITVKSTGFLIDELITTRFKVEVNPTPEIIQRMRLLDAAVRLRLNGREDDIYLQVVKLQIVLRQCWNAQEIVMKYSNIQEDPYIYAHRYNEYKALASAAVKAQQTNAERNKLVKEIDTVLGEESVSVLGKTYG